MLKILLFTFLVVIQGRASAASVMSHEKFVHLPPAEQREIVIATMKLIVELEDKYQHQVAQNGFNEERYRRYVQFMRHVSNLFFPEAHAARFANLNQSLTRLRTIITSTNRCLYAGWISDMGAGNKCNHPSNAWNQNVRDMYQAQSGCGTSSTDRSKITCNPAIFGFKNIGSKSLFCVDAGQGRDTNGNPKADNSSRDCMAKALGMYQPPEPDTSPTQERLDAMITEINGNPVAANAVFDFLVEACACSPNASRRQISQHYSNYMRPHQTCYSILRMLSEITPTCQVNGNPMMDANQTSFLASIKTLLNHTESSSEIMNASVGTTYEQRINGLVGRADLTAICGTTGGGGAVTVGECNTQTERRPDNTLCCREGRRAKADNSGCEDVPATAGGQCDPATERRPDGTLCCTEGREPNADGSACEPEAIVVTGRRCPEGQEYAGPDGSMTCQPKCPEGVTRDTEAPYACPTATSSTTVTFSLKQANKDATTITVTAEIGPEGVNAADYRVVWYRQGTNIPADVISADQTRTTPSIASADLPAAETSAEETAATEAAAAARTTAEAAETNQTLLSGNALTRDARRSTVDYKICARLIKNSDNSRAGADCEDIAKLPVTTPAGPRPAGGFNPFQQQPMMPTRGGPSDAIFRGIR